MASLTPATRRSPAADWPTLAVHVYSSGRVVVTNQDHPYYANGDHIGDVATSGAPVWIDMDGNGGCADTFERAVEELAQAAVDYATKKTEEHLGGAA